LGELAL